MSEHRLPSDSKTANVSAQEAFPMPQTSQNSRKYNPEPFYQIDNLTDTFRRLVQIELSRQLSKRAFSDVNRKLC